MLGAALWAYAAHAHAHAPNIATFVVGERAGDTVLTVHLSGAGLHHALGQIVDISTLDENAYKVAAVALLRDGTHLVLDGEPALLGKGAIRLGGHQTDVIFDLPDRPVASLLGSRITALSKVDNQHNVLRLDGPEPVQWVLAERNNFTLSAELGQPDEPAHDHGHEHEHGHDHADVHADDRNDATVPPAGLNLQEDPEVGEASTSVAAILAGLIGAGLLGTFIARRRGLGSSGRL